MSIPEEIVNYIIYNRLMVFLQQKHKFIRDCNYSYKSHRINKHKNK